MDFKAEVLIKLGIIYLEYSINITIMQSKMCKNGISKLHN